MFRRIRENIAKCTRCTKRLYPADSQVVVNKDRRYHAACMYCEFHVDDQGTECKVRLRSNNYVVNAASQIVCPKHKTARIASSHFKESEEAVLERVKRLPPSTGDPSSEVRTALHSSAAHEYVGLFQQITALGYGAVLVDALCAARKWPLLSHEALQPVVRGEAGSAFLVQQCALGRVSRVKELLRAGADAQAADAHGNTLLHIAFYARHAEMISELLNRGAALDARNARGDLPLCMVAARHTLPHVVRKDLKHGIFAFLREVNRNEAVVRGMAECGLNAHAALFGANFQLEGVAGLGDSALSSKPEYVRESFRARVQATVERLRAGEHISAAGSVDTIAQLTLVRGPRMRSPVPRRYEWAGEEVLRACKEILPLVKPRSSALCGIITSVGLSREATDELFVECVVQGGVEAMAWMLQHCECSLSDMPPPLAVEFLRCVARVTDPALAERFTERACAQGLAVEDLEYRALHEVLCEACTNGVDAVACLLLEHGVPARLSDGEAVDLRSSLDCMAGASGDGASLSSAVRCAAEAYFALKADEAGTRRSLGLQRIVSLMIELGLMEGSRKCDDGRPLAHQALVCLRHYELLVRLVRSECELPQSPFAVHDVIEDMRRRRPDESDAEVWTRHALQLEVLRALVQQRGESVVSRRGGETCLHVLMREALPGMVFVEALRVVLAAGADVNARAEDGATPLELLLKHATDSAVFGALPMLLRAGADVSGRAHAAAEEESARRRPPLLCWCDRLRRPVEEGSAVEERRAVWASTLDLLLSYGEAAEAAVAVQDDGQWLLSLLCSMSLGEAERYAHYQLVHRVLQCNVASVLSRPGARHPLSSAIRAGNAHLYDALLMVLPVSCVGSESPLLCAMERGDLSLAARLCAAGASAFDEASNEYLPRHIPMGGDDGGEQACAMVTVLRRHGLGLDARAQSDGEPLLSALVMRLVNSGAGRRPAYERMLEGLVEEATVEQLQAADACGYTLLHRAAQSGLCSLLERVLARVGQRQQMAGNGATPFACATSAVAKQLLLRPFVAQCSVCEEEATVAPVRPCGHWFCTECLARWSCANAGLAVRCPERSCTREVPLEELQRVLPGEAFDEVDRKVLEVACAQMDDFVWCPRCPSGGLLDTACGESACNECAHEWCGFCGGERHPEGEACDARLERHAVRRWKSEHSRKCPKCATHTEHGGGCTHMTCAQCQYSWCWACGGPYVGRYSFNINVCPCEDSDDDFHGW